MSSYIYYTSKKTKSILSSKSCKTYLSEKNLSFQEIKDGVVLPGKTENGLRLGGVSKTSGEFVEMSAWHENAGGGM